MKRVFIGLLLFPVLLLAFQPAMAADPAEIKVGPNVGNRIPDFSMKSPIDQKSLDQKTAFPQGKDTALLFMQTACSLCVAEVREFISAKDEIEGKLNVILVSVDMNPERMPQYLKNLGSTFTALHDTDAKFLETLGFNSTPALVIVNSQGVIKEKFPGYDQVKTKTLLKSYR